MQFPFSVYSLSLKLAERASYWNPEVIPEDWHMFLRCFYATAGRAHVLPLYMPVGCECVAAETPLGSLGACYTQSKRWQWGVSDIGFIIVMSARACASCAIGPVPLIRVLCAAIEHHLIYPVMWVAVALSPWILGRHWAGATQFAFVTWITFVVLNWSCLVALDSAYRKKLTTGRMHFRCEAGSLCTTGALRRVGSLALFPLADVLLFVVPSFHAHARMALSTQFDYIVAPKVVSIPKTCTTTPPLVSGRVTGRTEQQVANREEEEIGELTRKTACQPPAHNASSDPGSHSPSPSSVMASLRGYLKGGATADETAPLIRLVHDHDHGAINGSRSNGGSSDGGAFLKAIRVQPPTVVFSTSNKTCKTSGPRPAFPPAHFSADLVNAH